MLHLSQEERIFTMASFNNHRCKPYFVTVDDSRILLPQKQEIKIEKSELQHILYTSQMSRWKSGGQFCGNKLKLNVIPFYKIPPNIRKEIAKKGDLCM